MNPQSQTFSSNCLPSCQDIVEPCIQDSKTFYQTCMSPSNSHHAASSFEYVLESLLPHPPFCQADQWSDMRLEELSEWDNLPNGFMTLQTVFPKGIFHQRPWVLHSSVQYTNFSNEHFETLPHPFAKGAPVELVRRAQRYAKGSESTPTYAQRPGEQNHAYKSSQHERFPTTGNWLFKCSEAGCKGRFKREDHLKRHMKTHSNDKPFVCWVPGCQRGFSRSDNLTAHYRKTHAKKGGRNRYVPSLDESSSLYDPEFRGQLAPDGSPLYTS